MKKLIYLRFIPLLIWLFNASESNAQFTFKKMISSSTDDAEERQTGGTIDITSSDIELVNDGTTVGDQTVGLRFSGINIPKGAVINKAYIQFWVDENQHTASTSVNIFGEASDNSAAFSTAGFNISSRTKTSASVSWNSIPVWPTVNINGADQNTPDIKSVINEIIGRSGWNTGNAITILITGTGRRNAHAYDGQPTMAPQLVIEYTPKNYVVGNFPLTKNSLWMYHDSGYTPGGTWNARDYANDSNWKFGFGILGYGLNDENTALNFGGNTSNKRTAYYLRNQFNVADSTVADSLIFRLMCDDGAIVYLNGKEVFRRNMPSGSVSYSTLASSEVQPADENSYFEYRIGDKLRQGKNVIAAEVHIADPASTDVRFDMELAAKKPRMAITNFPLVRGANWYYNDKGYDYYATSFSDSSFDDKGWEHGPAPLGYGDPMSTTISFGDAANKYISYYFRKQINVPSVASINADSLLLYIRRDDGAVIYINGKEVARSNMDTGKLNYKSVSLTTIDGSNETLYNPIVLKKSVLKDGVNTIAVAMHQRDSSSSDLGFDLELVPYPKIGGGCAPNDAHISCFSSLIPGAQTTVMQIPSTHRFEMLFKQGTPYTQISGNVPGNHDFTAYVGKNGSSTEGVVAVNHETSPGAVSLVYSRYIDSVQLWTVDSTNRVDFYNNDVVSTGRNCSGGITPWGTVITSEETTTSADANSDGYHDLGWHVEFNPWTGQVVDYGNGKREKLWRMGKMNHENIVVLKDSITAFFGEDGGTQCVYKFVADKKGDLSNGKLYVLKMDQALNSGEPAGTTGKWIQVPNATKTECNSIASLAQGLGGTNFNGVEDCEVNPLNGMIYFTSKGFNRTYRFKDGDSTVSDFITYVGNKTYTLSTASGLYSEAWGSGNDNLTFDDKGNLWVLQDGSRNHFWLVRDGHTQADPRVELFMVSPGGSEPTGMTFSPDYKFMFVSLQHPNGTNIGQVDASGNTVSINASASVVISRKEYLGATKPVAGFEADKYKIYVGDSITLRDTSSFKATSRVWTIEKGTQSGSNGKVVTSMFSDTGYFTVKLKVSNQAGTDSVTKTSVIDVMPLIPQAKIAADKLTVIEGNSINFGDISTGTVNSRSWIINGASVATSKDSAVNSFFAGMGTYKVILAVANRGGVGYDTVTVTINPRKPIVSFYTDKIETIVNQPIQLVDNSTGFVADRKWKVAGGAIASDTSKVTTVTFANTGFYSVTLNIANVSGSDSVMKVRLIYVKPSVPVSAFISNKQSIVEDNFVLFQDQSTGTVDKYKWEFPGGFPSQSGDQNPSVFYETPGVYPVTLTVSNETGSHTTTRSSYITVTKNTAGIGSLASLGSVEIYPVPVTDAMTVSFDFAAASQTVVLLKDLSGKTVAVLYEGLIGSGKTETRFELGKYALSAGVYFVDIQSGSETLTKKIIKNYDSLNIKLKRPCKFCAAFLNLDEVIFMSNSKFVIFFFLPALIFSCSSNKSAYTPVTPESGKMYQTMDEALVDPAAVKYLNLRSSGIVKLSPRISEFQNLEFLNLMKNKMDTLQPELFKLGRIRELNIRDNKLSFIQNEIGNLGSLVYLDLAKNKFTSFPSGFTKLKNLEYLFCSYNKITSFPIDVDKMSRLHHIEMYHNELVDLGRGFAKLKSLTFVHLGNNHITELPENFFKNNSNLEELVLENNEILRLPEDIGDAKKLKTLVLTANRITTIPETIVNAGSLEILILSGNPIRELPQNISLMRNLRTLLLVDTQLSNEEKERIKTSLPGCDVRF